MYTTEVFVVMQEATIGGGIVLLNRDVFFSRGVAGIEKGNALRLRVIKFITSLLAPSHLGIEEARHRVIFVQLVSTADFIMWVLN